MIGKYTSSFGRCGVAALQCFSLFLAVRMVFRTRSIVYLKVQLFGHWRLSSATGSLGSFQFLNLLFASVVFSREVVQKTGMAVFFYSHPCFLILLFRRTKVSAAYVALRDWKSFGVIQIKAIPAVRGILPNDCRDCFVWNWEIYIHSFKNRYHETV